MSALDDMNAWVATMLSGDYSDSEGGVALADAVQQEIEAQVEDFKAGNSWSK